jgi:hypothetical protein
MVSTILILGVAGVSLALVWSLLRSREPHIGTLQEWEARKHEIDIAILQALLDRNEERYLRNSLTRNHFRAFQRRRLCLVVHMLGLIEENAGMVMKLGQLARLKGDPVLTHEADELVATAIQLRLNLLLVKLCLALKWLFPYWSVSVPAFEGKYRDLLDCLVRVQQRGRQALT